MTTGRKITDLTLDDLERRKFQENFANEVEHRVSFGSSFAKELVFKMFSPMALPLLRFTRIVEGIDKLDFLNETFNQFTITVTSRDPLDITLTENNIFLYDSNTAFLLDDGDFMELD